MNGCASSPRNCDTRLRTTFSAAAGGCIAPQGIDELVDPGDPVTVDGQRRQQRPVEAPETSTAVSPTTHSTGPSTPSHMPAERTGKRR